MKGNVVNHFIHGCTAIHQDRDIVFLRRFVKATQLKPTQYIQHLRVQKACELLETTLHSFEWIANQVGYEDVSACRKIFVRTMGLTPGEFKKRFVNRRS